MENVTKHIPKLVGDGEKKSSINIVAGDNCMAVTQVLGVGHNMAITKNMEKMHDAGVISGDSVQIMGMGHDSGVPGGERTVVARIDGSCLRDGKLAACMEGANSKDYLEGHMSAMECFLSTSLHTLQHMNHVEGISNADVSVGEGDIKLRRWKWQARGAIGSGSQTLNQSHAGPKKRPVDRPQRVFPGMVSGRRVRHLEWMKL
jgi:hypothetical protein